MIKEEETKIRIDRRNKEWQEARENKSTRSLWKKTYQKKFLGGSRSPILVNNKYGEPDKKLTFERFYDF